VLSYPVRPPTRWGQRMRPQFGDHWTALGDDYEQTERHDQA
jgi:hypothetical protein